LQNITVGGAAGDPAWAAVLGLAGIDLDVGYGLTEAGPVVAMGRASESPAGSVGRPLPGVQVRVGTGGEILVRTASVMSGYAGDASATRDAFTDGWLRTGDNGRIDDAGFLYVTGRLKDAMVTAAGETIYPDEIEPYYASPLFAEFSIVPLPGPDGNDQPTLVVVPADDRVSDGDLHRTMASLRAAAPARLRIVGFIRRREPLPRSATGKIRRKVLASEVHP
jgi:long-subunit acyl-CoA synthetase (AMP-forming)